MKSPVSPLHEAIHRQTAREMIRDKIVSMIASGVLQMGDELPGERELSTMLAVSRETVRGAIQLLGAVLGDNAEPSCAVAGRAPSRTARIATRHIISSPRSRQLSHSDDTKKMASNSI